MDVIYVCRQCQKAKPASEFGRDPRKRSGVKSYCRPCESRNSARWNRANRDKTYDAHLRRQYGITLEEYAGLLAEQGGVCAVCGSPGENRDCSGNAKRLEVHHNHATGQVVALLCWNCNIGMGKFGDDPELLRRAAFVQEGHAPWMSSTG